ncbi:MAG TPA: branched-chain amino acid ABC transporter substrate-binding protein [Candidatus Dormibacteraeota bacterium]|nr:branched-chain amino acid ABC transporter substrate-binding protein [Candidatus Dormibacteraeota bacterium]
MVRARGFAVLIVAAFVAFACGGTTSTGSKGTIIIASDLPTSGADASSGLPTQYGAAFAVSQKGSIQGYTLQFLPLDDAVNGKHDPVKGAQNVQQFISNSQVLGMVGPFNSGVAAAEIPVANQAPLAMISPSNTNQCLTLAFDYCQAYAGYTAAGLRPTGKNNYFRVAANDTKQGPAMADYAYDTLKLTKIAVWDDQEPFGAGVAQTFADEFTKKGGTVIDKQGFPTSTKPDFHAWLNKAKTDGAQGIYAGATSASYGCLPRAQSQGIFDPSSYYLGPDGIGDGQCITDSGTTMGNDHMYASQGVADANANPSAAATIAAYKVAHPNPTDTAAYTFAGYDCAAILIDAIDRAITKNGGNLPTRQQVIDQMATTTAFKGLTGTYTLNAAGDPTTPALQIQQYKAGAWTTVQNIQL